MKIPSYLYKMKFSGIYVIENSVNHKRYIGSSNSVYQRLHKHNSLLNKNKHENTYLQNAWNKYGSEKFECYIVEFSDNLTKTEQKWIDILEPEYNITYLVQRNVLSEESRKKISKTLKKKYKSGEIKATKTSPISAYDLDGNHVEDFDTIREASRKLNIHPTSIIRVLKGIYYQAKNYQFKYQNEEREIKAIEKSKYARRFLPAPVKSGEFRESPEKDNTEPS